MAYDQNNIFAKILRGEIPCEKVFENEHILAFNDIARKALVHILIIPKGPYVSFADFSEKASADEIVALNRAIGEIAKEKEIVESGYRVISNHAAHAHQEVPHYHVHLLGGADLGGCFN
ncbi:HIT domain-containing protein [Kiloniella sp. EL199]|uniref:HIT domain-containing protein n=1 Tax=Kiloniella sp. EL199 TaxID=2107581 RepID=UPI000EA317FF|nr:HIT domain-containing protein [Kiloniella sp. EL199]